jgi:hypothetical protein
MLRKSFVFGGEMVKCPDNVRCEYGPEAEQIQIQKKKKEQVLLIA